MAITCFWGSLGSGKSYSMTAWARLEMRNSLCQVYTDMQSLRFPEQVYLSIERMEEIAYIDNGVLMLDEAQIGFAAAKWQSVPAESMRAMAQFRKNGLEVVYTTQHPDRVVKVLRENTHNWVRCRKCGPMVLQAWKEDLGQKKAKFKWVPLQSVNYALYDTYEVLGQKPSRRLARSRWLDYARAARSASERRPTSDPFRRPIWHVSRDGVQQLTIHAREVLRTLQVAGVVAGGVLPREQLGIWQMYIAEECRRRLWLQAFGLRADQVAKSTTLEHPWAELGCHCHEVMEDPKTKVMYSDAPEAPIWASNVVLPRRARDVAVAGVDIERGVRGAGQAIQIAGELLADRLRVFQVSKGA